MNKINTIILVGLVTLAQLGAFAGKANSNSKSKVVKNKSVEGSSKKRKPTTASESPLQSHESDKMTIISMDPDMSLEGFDSKEYNVYSRPQVQKSEVPTPTFRDQLFQQAGITARDVGAYDELDKDMLYLSAKNLDVNRLKQKYQFIHAEKLLKLKLIIRRHQN